jgi:hypothetical protein
MPFERPHHQRIARLLESLDGQMLRERRCLFGGGTAIALKFGEYRESVDVDFLVSELPRYASLRILLTGQNGLAAITRAGAAPLQHVTPVTSDEYTIKTRIAIDGQPIKFEIVSEGRIALEPPGAADEVCGIATLTPLDMVTSKLLANADRWPDDGVFSRDLIDLAMMRPSLPLLRNAVAKAEATAYGESVLRSLGRAIDQMLERTGWLERCMEVMAIAQARALVWQRIRALRRALS